MTKLHKIYLSYVAKLCYILNQGNKFLLGKVQFGNILDLIQSGIYSESK